MKPNCSCWHLHIRINNMTCINYNSKWTVQTKLNSIEYETRTNTFESRESKVGTYATSFASMYWIQQLHLKNLSKWMSNELEEHSRSAWKNRRQNHLYVYIISIICLYMQWFITLRLVDDRWSHCNHPRFFVILIEFYSLRHIMNWNQWLNWNWMIFQILNRW